MRIYFLCFSLFFVACATEPVSSRIIVELPVENDSLPELVEAVNRKGFTAYGANSSAMIKPLAVWNLKTSDMFKQLAEEIETESSRLNNGKNEWKGSFETDEQVSSEGIFLTGDRSVNVAFSKVWSERYHQTDTYQFMEIAYADSRMVADVFFPRDDFENFVNQFSYETYREALNTARPGRAKVFVPLFERGVTNKVSVQSKGIKGRSIECGPFPEVPLTRPFIFVVRDPKTDLILFMGSVDEV